MTKFGPMVLAVLIAGMLVSWSAIAWAATPEISGDTNVIHELARVVLSALGVALATLVTFYVPRLATAIERRLKVDIPDPLELEAVRLATDAIGHAEEWARGRAKEAGERVLSSVKLDRAAAYFRDHASPSVIRWVNDTVESYLEAKLGQLRLRLAQSHPLTAAAPADVEDGPTGPLQPGVR